jgi:penicillin-binding protein 1B
MPSSPKTSSSFSSFASLVQALWRLLRRPWVLVVLALLGVATVFVLRPFWRLSGQFDEITYRQPSRLYGRQARLLAGRAYPVERVIEDLESEGYRADAGDPLPAGRYRRTAGGLAVHLRTFPTPEGPGGGGVVEATYREGRITDLRVDGRPAPSALLEPPLLASYYGPDQCERRPVKLADVAQDLIESVVAAEDDDFFHHSGISPSGILRAVWVNLRGREIRQGGSTLTQQLVKNVYLSHQRTWGRKAQELVLAVLVEMRYRKEQILAAYLNEIYMGGSGGVSLLGMGAASRAYFGKDPGQLDLAEAATLAGMIRAPAVYSPLAHPDRARERRDWVLHRLEELKRVPPERVARALAEPLSVAPEPLVRRRAPYFADAMALEAQRRFGVENLADAGYFLFSTLDWRNQKEAQRAVELGLAAAEKGYEKAARKEPLQAALVSLDPATGALLSYVGGRDFYGSQFDRAGQAQRQAGSAFKPIVYAAAFEAHKASPASFLEDEPLEVPTAAGLWSPKNDDGSYHGWVSVRTALEHSYNPATARLALDIGLPKIVALAHGMGIAEPMDPFPAVALGATAITPVELATAYATLATGGVRPPVHGLAAVLDPHRKPVAGVALPKPERALTPQTAYLVTSLLQGVLERGTGRGAAAELRGDLAGKTGTTNRQRDSWFAGYSPERTTVVWVGYDDNSSTRLSGARAALPIWSRFTVAVAPPGGYSGFRPPPGITTAVIDPTTGLLATDFCPVVLTEVFREGEVPSQLCDRHQSPYEQAIAQATEGRPEDEGGGEDEPRATVRRGEPGERLHPFRRWLRRIFGVRPRGREEGPDEVRPEEEPPPEEASPPG